MLCIHPWLKATYDREAYSLGSNYTSGSGTSGNGSSFVSRREMRATNQTGALPIISTSRSYSGSFDFDNLIASLRELFAQDRQVASQQDGTRCGVCYLHFSISSLTYREEEEGFYVCVGCERALGKYKIPMLRRQQK
jgi:hypothetical protein